VEVIADDVAKSFDLFIRARAFFMTAAFVSITDTTWFPLQSAVQASEVIMNLITATWDNRLPPVSFHITAWGTTVHHFSEQIRITKRSLKDVVENIGAWEHNWKWSPSSSSSAPSSGSGGAPDNQSLINQLASMKGQMLQYKQQADEANQRTINASRDRRERSQEDDFSESKRSRGGNGGGFGGGGFGGGKGGKGRGGKGGEKRDDRGSRGAPKKKGSAIW
jgi:hypothetical protein